MTIFLTWKLRGWKMGKPLSSSKYVWMTEYVSLLETDKITENWKSLVWNWWNI